MFILFSMKYSFLFVILFSQHAGVFEKEILHI